MTNQDVFNRVVTHLRAQGRRAVDERGKCRYRAPDDTKCAAGCLILDEYYHLAMEGSSATGNFVWAALRRSGVPEDASILVSDLQIIHDNYEPQKWELQFACIARDYNLTYAPPH